MKHRKTVFKVEIEFVANRNQAKRLIDAYQIFSDTPILATSGEENDRETKATNISSSLCSCVGRQAKKG
jgi:hypothetical protein